MAPGRPVVGLASGPTCVSPDEFKIQVSEDLAKIASAVVVLEQHGGAWIRLAPHDVAGNENWEERVASECEASVDKGPELFCEDQFYRILGHRVSSGRGCDFGAHPSSGDIREWEGGRFHRFTASSHEQGGSEDQGIHGGQGGLLEETPNALDVARSSPRAVADDAVDLWRGHLHHPA